MHLRPRGQNRLAVRRSTRRIARFRPHIECLESRLALSVHFVDHDAPGLDNGTSWPDAFRDLQSALAAGQAGDQVWVAEGTYHPTQSTDQQATFRLPDGASVYGGFAGGETALDDRDPLAHPTTLSGEVGRVYDFYDNSFHVVTVDPGVTARLDSVQIRLGFAFGPDEESRRGGAIVNHGNLTLARTVLNSNQATDQGGNIYNTGELLVIGSQVELGGSRDGGGIYNLGRATLLGSSVTFNGSIDGRGGGVFNGGDFTAINATIGGNEAVQGGGLFHESGTVSLAHTTVSHNTVRDWNNAGGGIYTDIGGITISHTLVANNYQRDPIATIAPNDVHGSFELGSSFNLIGVSDGTTRLTHGINGNQVGTIGTPIDPRLADEPDYHSHLDGQLTAYVPLLPGSPAIDAGDPAFDPTSFTPPLLEDELGRPRVSPGTFASTARIDIGAFETLPLHLVVTVVADEVDGDYSPDDLSLREAIILANGNAGPNLIDVPDGHYALSLPSNSPCNRDDFPHDDLKIVGRISTTIRGAGMGRTVVDARGQHRVFTVWGTAELADLTIQGGFANPCDGRGGGIFVDDEDDLTLRRVELQNNVAIRAGGGLFLDEDSHARIFDSIIRNNVALDGAPGNTKSGKGGGIYSLADDLTIYDTDLQDNQADIDGGGVFNSGATVTITGGEFGRNHSGDNGGGMYDLGGQVTITDSQFVGNSGDDGGGIASLYGTLTLNRAILRQNSAGDGDGGGLSGFDATINIDNSQILENTADDSGGGGGIAVAGGTLTLRGSSVRLNRAGSEADVQGDGGGLYLGNGTIVELIDSDVSQNSAVFHGGGIFADRIDRLSIQRSRLADNLSRHAGGGLYVRHANVVIHSSTIEGNAAGIGHGAGEAHSGGGAFVTGTTTFDMRDSTVSGNRVDGLAGGLMIVDDTRFSITNSTISGNSAVEYGGIFITEDAPGTIAHSTIVDNHAQRQAGFGYDDPIVLTHSIIARNRVNDVPGGRDLDLAGWYYGGSFNLIGAIDESWGYQNGVNGNNVGSPESPIDPRLGPLEFNGGPTRTHMPLPGSPVIEAGDPAFDPALFTPPLVADQRGQRRVVDGNGDFISRIDIGAVEVSPFFMFADITEDGRVDLLDLVALQSNFGDTTAEYLQGDLNADGRIDRADAAILLENFGRVMPTPTPPAPAAVTAAKRAVASRSAGPAGKVRLSATAIRRAPVAAAIDLALTTNP
jgi:hypothetical protein